MNDLEEKKSLTDKLKRLPARLKWLLSEENCSPREKSEVICFVFEHKNLLASFCVLQLIAFS